MVKELLEISLLLVSPLQKKKKTYRKNFKEWKKQITPYSCTYAWRSVTIDTVLVSRSRSAFTRRCSSTTLGQDHNKKTVLFVFDGYRLVFRRPLANRRHPPARRCGLTVPAVPTAPPDIATRTRSQVLGVSRSTYKIRYLNIQSIRLENISQSEAITFYPNSRWTWNAATSVQEFVDNSALKTGVFWLSIIDFSLTSVCFHI